MRKGHFEGVLTVVAKLFNIIQPTNAYFGEKDYQQYLLIKNMVKAFFLYINVVPCPIVREDDGLAMSSRNNLLNPEERILASEFPKILMSDESIEEKIKQLESQNIQVEYLEKRFDRLFSAVQIGNVRLIDNVKI